MNSEPRSNAPPTAAPDWSVVRAGLRLVRLAGAIGVAALDLVARVIAGGGRLPRRARAVWLQHSCARLLPIFGIEVTLQGDFPCAGLLVSNHLGYLDVLVLAATTPGVFVAKSEVRRWPVFSWFARAAGTIFVERTRRTDTGHVVEAMTEALSEDLVVVLFPEGTSTGGDEVRPFRSALLDAAVRHGRAVSPVAIDYRLPGGDAAAEVCYWKDMTLVPHLANLLGHRRVEARLAFRPAFPVHDDRKQLAASLRNEVLLARESLRLLPCPA